MNIPTQASTPKNQSPLVRAEALMHLSDPESLVLIDARTGPQAREAFETQHLAGARYVDMDLDLARKEKNPVNGGRHPLPEPAEFARLLGQLGISPASRVVVYDDKNGANAAARFWWMLRAAGHHQVQLLDGGLQAALAAGYRIATGPAEVRAAEPYPFREWALPTVDADEVAEAVADPAALVIDVRDAARYRGEVEPIDLIAGHIPGAVNVPYTDNLDPNGFYHSPEALKERYAAVIGDRDPARVVVHCGSGVTACHTLLALELAGYQNPALYVGSWSEWSRNDRPMVTLK